MKKLTVMTFNAWSGLDYLGLLRMGYFEGDDERRARFRSLVAGIRRARPDILGLSEANPLPGYAREIASLTDMDEIRHMGVSGIRVGPFGIPSNLREGDIILARKGLGLRLIARAWLGGAGWVRDAWSFHSGDVTQAILGAITIAGEDIYVAQAHLRHAPPPNEGTLSSLDRLARDFRYSAREHRAALASLRADTRRKKEEVLRLRDFLARAMPPGAPLLLMGDFNAEPAWPCMTPLFDAGFRIVAPGEGKNTWDGEGNGIIRKYYRPLASVRHGSLYRHLLSVFDVESRCIDFILASPAIAPERVTSSGLCLTGAGGAALSDHYGVTAVVDM
jgi:hypothetical protein